ncbi:MAG: nucleotidyltransferase domain-containing protein [Candidatus Gottesmanbacteria bacterium]|nr:nucleotidyltransferase domain-containing protein [Candidatus Gottesmanbacteria bacterium]
MIDDRSLAILTDVIKKHLDTSQYKAFVFGSRTQRTMHRKYADVDVGVLGPAKLPVSILMQIKEDLHNSDIPYLTDVVDFSAVSQDFREKALSHILPL